MTTATGAVSTPRIAMTTTSGASVGETALDAISGGMAAGRVAAGSAAGALARALARSPGLASRARALAGELARVAVGRSELAPAAADARFADPAWHSHPLYRRLGQAYLAMEQTIVDAVAGADVDWRTAERARFAAGVLASALAPTNTLPGNPAALKHALDTAGMSLVRGARNLVADLATNRGMPRQVDTRPFRLGENIGVTPGQVVFRNEVVEIIQYTPATPTAHAVPMLVTWSLINRFYILDLAPGRSFIEYAVSRGITVFLTSWRNPTTEHAHWDLDTYAAALIDAMEAIREISGSARIGTLGLCSGGQLLAATLAHLSAQGDDRIAYASFGVSQLDLSVPNVAGLALSPPLLGLARLGTMATGIVDGRDIAAVFAWLRPNELVWSFWVNNYLMGRDPPAFDVLAWNADTTRLPGAAQLQLLEIAEHNQLAEPGALTLLGTPVDLSKITVDAYVIGAETDHLVPWQGAYRTTQLLGGDATFLLSGGGHIQHLINPPGNPKARFRTGPAPGPDPMAWHRSTTVHKGTWWDHWSGWVAARSGARRRVRRTPGSRAHRPLEPAPGSYVRQP